MCVFVLNKTLTKFRFTYWKRESRRAMRRKGTIITAYGSTEMLFELNFEAQNTLYACTLSSRPLQSGEELICQVYPSTTLQSSS